MNQREYQICTNCIMGTTNFKITFDDKVVCGHCRDFYENVLPNWHTFSTPFFFVIPWTPQGFYYLFSHFCMQPQG